MASAGFPVAELVGPFFRLGAFHENEWFRTARYGSVQ